MKYVVTAEEMKACDANTTDRIGIPGVVLMERAALAVLEELKKRFEPDRRKGRGEPPMRVLIFAGTGNNGADGLALARLLVEAGYEVCVGYAGDAARASELWERQRQILSHYSVPVLSWKDAMCGGGTELAGSKMPNREYTILVDALFGIGLSREIAGEYADAVDRFNEVSGFKAALDIPSGIHADTGKVMGCAVRADLTVTFGFAKRGLLCGRGRLMAGEVVTADIGISPQSFFGKIPDMFYYDEAGKELLPKRTPQGNKGTFGKVLLAAGSLNMAGAAILSARAAYRAGAGMVRVITPSENRCILQGALPEALLGTEEDLEQSMEWADVIAIGPGLGQGDAALDCLKTVIERSRLPLVVDADGLNLLAEHKELQRELASQKRELILTPHVGELSRLTGKSVETLQEDLPAHGRDLAQKLHGVVAAKDARTCICAEHKPVCINLRGNSGMATAGSGDVLTGVIAGLLAQGMTPYEAACVGVYIHALAGDFAARRTGEHGLMAGDIIEGLTERQALD